MLMGSENGGFATHKASELMKNLESGFPYP